MLASKTTDNGKKIFLAEGMAIVLNFDNIVSWKYLAFIILCHSERSEESLRWVVLEILRFAQDDEFVSILFLVSVQINFRSR